MTELINLERELDRFRARVLAAVALMLIGFALLVVRLSVLQILRHEELSTRAEANRVAVVPIVPDRGRIVDRNGIVLATNYTAYTLEITPSRVENLEDTINQLAEIVDIQPRDRRRFKRQLEESKSFESLPIRNRLTDDELAKEHIRHMVGGRSELAQDERLYRFEFPERPGALMRFLSAMHPDWNISLFHYRNQGADYGRILVGMQVPKADKKAFKDFLAGLAYPCTDETDNPVYRLFLK